MADSDDQPESRSGWRLRPWQGRLIAALLIVGGVLHAFKPAWLTLDWPSIALILLGILLLFLPLDDLGAVIESLEFGKTKILFRKVKQLDDAVEQAIREEVAPINLSRLVGKRAFGLEAELGDDEDEAESVTSVPPTSLEGGQTTGVKGKTPDTGRTEPPDFLDDRRMRSLLETDKEMALIRIGIEIERILAGLERDNGIAARTPGVVWSRTIKGLEQQELITPQMAKALIEFRNVRNQLVHPSAGAVPESLVTSAVDSGLKLLRLLSSIADINKPLPPNRDAD
jgi:hypothetical protein